MIKATQISLGLAALLVLPAGVFAQTNDSAIGMAVQQSVINQANTIVLRQKLVDAQAAAQRGDILNAAKLYQDCVSLAQTVGSGIDSETAQAVAGLSNASMILARDAQSRGDLREADVRVTQVLKADPKNPIAIAFKKHNDDLLAANKGLMPSDAVAQQVPAMIAQKTDAATLVQDGKLLYEMGKLEDAGVKLNAALKLDPDNQAANYYLNLIDDANVRRNVAKHSVDSHVRMNLVEKAWVLPTSKIQFPSPNPYATNNLTYTGPGRQIIIDKLNRIHLDNPSFDGLPLSEVLRQLVEQSKLRDPDRKGINFLINPNPDQSGQPVAGPAQTGNPGGAGGFGGGDPNLPPAGANTAGGGAVEKIDIGSVVTVKLNLNDVSMAELLDAIIKIADHPDGHQLKYSIEDYGVVFSDKGPETPLLMMRTFKVDPNTFYSGLDSVNAESFGSTANSSSGGGSGGGGGGSSSQNQSSSIVGVVDSVPGASQARQSGGQGGGGGGGGSQTSGSNPLDRGGATGGAQSSSQGGGLRYVTKVSLAADVSMAAKNFFTTLGVNLQSPPGKSVFFNDRLGVLFVKATSEDLDTIDRAIQALNQIAPQVHIKARFIEVQEANMNALGFQWYLGQFNIGQGVVGQGGSSGSLSTPTTPANPMGTFPGTTPASQVAGSAGDQLVTGGLRNALGAPAIGTITGILTNPNFQVALQALEQRTGTEELAEPEVVTTSGRQTQMRATSILTIITSFTFQQGTAASTTGSTTQ